MRNELNLNELNKLAGGGKPLSGMPDFRKHSIEEHIWRRTNSINSPNGKSAPSSRTPRKCAGTDGGTKDFETIGDDCHDRY